jgi:hypothetical protein
VEDLNVAESIANDLMTQNMLDVTVAQAIPVIQRALVTETQGTLSVGDNDIFRLACKLVDTASSDRKMYWLPVLSQLCEAVRKQDAGEKLDEHLKEINTK